MNNNDIFKKLRFIFGWNNQQLIALFALSNHVVSIDDVKSWQEKEGNENYKELKDIELSMFLNGFIVEKRGKREGDDAEAEIELSNNDILKKLKVALSLKTDEIITVFEFANRKVSKHELSAFLRNPKQEQYRSLLDQYLRGFLTGLQKKLK